MVDLKKKAMLNIGKLSAATSIGLDSNSIKKTEHFHTVSQTYIHLGEDQYLYIKERCIECGKILNESRIKTEPYGEVTKWEDREWFGAEMEVSE